MDVRAVELRDLATEIAHATFRARHARAEIMANNSVVTYLRPFVLSVYTVGLIEGGQMPLDWGGWTRVEDPAALRRAGEAAGELAGETRVAGELPEAPMQRAFGEFNYEHWDGELGAALSNSLSKWSGQTNSLVSKCGSFGVKCTDTADNFGEAERTNTAVVRAAGSTDSPFG